MTYELREGQGSLWPQEPRTETQPLWNGTVKLGGQMHRIAAWPRETRTGARYLSIKVTPLERATAPLPDPKPAAQRPAPAPPPRPKVDPEFNDEIPFTWAALVPLGALLAHVCRVGGLLT